MLHTQDTDICFCMYNTDPVLCPPPSTRCTHVRCMLRTLNLAYMMYNALVFGPKFSYVSPCNMTATLLLNPVSIGRRRPKCPQTDNSSSLFSHALLSRGPAHSSTRKYISFLNPGAPGRYHTDPKDPAVRAHSLVVLGLFSPVPISCRKLS